MRDTEYRIFATSWGYMAVAAVAQGLARIILPQSNRRHVERAIREVDGTKGVSCPRKRSTRGVRRTADRLLEAILDAAERQIVEYLDGARRDFDLPFVMPPDATAFAQAVWRACGEIAYGQTRSYGRLAAQTGRPRAVRAVGGALGANPLPLIVPCHRVVRSDGSLGGFGGGLPLKARLLALERTREEMGFARGTQ